MPLVERTAVRLFQVMVRRTRRWVDGQVRGRERRRRRVQRRLVLHGIGAAVTAELTSTGVEVLASGCGIDQP